MKTITANDYHEGLILAENIYSSEGQLIIPAYSRLTRQMIHHLKFYRIESINIIEGEEPIEAQKAKVIKEQIEKNFEYNMVLSNGYREFRDNYQKNIKLIEKNFNDIILKNTEIDEPNLISDTIKLFDTNPTTYSLFSLLHSMKKIDDSTYAHCINVSIIARLIGTWVNLPEEELDHLTLAGLLHDLGKCKIPDDILLKPGKLTQQEFDFIKKHPTFGYEIIKGRNIDSRIKDAVLHHHERYDGTGYPDKLSSTQIEDFTAIVSIADVYDAMTSNRCYRMGLCPFDVIATFESEGLAKYHPEYIGLFLNKIANSYINTEVLLNNSKKARIIMINNNKLTRPVVQIADQFIDLREHPDLYIEAIV